MAIKRADAFIEVLLDYARAEKDAANMDKTIGGITEGTMTKLGAGMTAAGAAITGTLGVAATSAAGFGKELANVSTLGVQDLGALDEGTRDLAVKFGIDLNDAMKATYETISAGIPEDAAIMVMEQAARGAQAGVGTLGDALDLGTSVMNAWNMQGQSANETASNMERIMGMAATAAFKGKTTFAEMAGSIGQVAPVMSAAGVGADEFFAALSGLTATGLPTSSAMTQLQQAVSNIIKPSAQASELAAQLGLEFNATALQSQGLAGFLDSVKQATGGNIEQLGVLFGSTEALGAVLSLTGNQAGVFKESLTEMAQAQDNLSKMQAAFIANNPALAFQQLKAEMQNLFILVGRTVMPLLQAILPPVKAVLGTIAEFIERNPTLAAGIGTVVAAIGGLLLGLGSLSLTLAAFMPLITFLTGAPGFAGLATAMGGTGAAAAGAAGAGGLGALVVSAGALLATAGMVIAILAASGFAIYKFGKAAIEAGKAVAELARKKGETARMMEDYTDQLEKQGVALDRAALREMNHAQRSAALTQASINHKEEAMAREIRALTGVDATREQIHNGELARVALGISAGEAAAMAVEGLTKEEILSRQQAAAETRKAEAAKQAAIAATYDHQAASLADTLNAMNRHSEMEQVGAAEVSEFKRLMLSGDVEAANQYWTTMRTQTGQGLGQTLEQYKAFRIAVEAEMALLRQSIGYALNPDQTGSPSLNMQIADGHRTTISLLESAITASETMIRAYRDRAVAMLTGWGPGLIGSMPTPSVVYQAGAGTPLSGGTTNNSSTSNNNVNVNINASGTSGDAAKEIAGAVREQIGIVLGQTVRDRARARGVRQPGVSRTPRIPAT